MVPQYQGRVRDHHRGPELKWVIIHSTLPRGIVNVRTLSVQESRDQVTTASPSRDISVYTTSPVVIGPVITQVAGTPKRQVGG